MIRDEAMREKIKSLWKLCFNDSDEFTDMYFRLRYSNEVNIAIQSGEEVIAALQILPYPMTFGKSEIKTGYVSGACTHPDYRNRGAMRELLSQAFTRMLHNDMSISTLIPAEPWLFGYYAGMGYVPVFKYSSTTFTASEVTIADKTAVLNKINDYQEESYRYLNRKLRERPYCIQHTETDFRVILADLQLGKGCAYTLKQGDKITALAIVYPAGIAICQSPRRSTGYRLRRIQPLESAYSRTRRRHTQRRAVGRHYNGNIYRLDIHPA